MTMMSASKTAERLGIPETALTYWLRKGRVPGAIKVSNMWLVPETVTTEDIDIPQMGRPPTKKANGDNGR